LTRNAKLVLFPGFLFQILRKQFFKALDRVIRDAGEDFGEPVERLDVVDFAGGKERIHNGCSLGTFVRTCKQIIFPAQLM